MNTKLSLTPSGNQDICLPSITVSTDNWLQSTLRYLENYNIFDANYSYWPKICNFPGNLLSSNIKYFCPCFSSICRSEMISVK